MRACHLFHFTFLTEKSMLSVMDDKPSIVTLEEYGAPLSTVAQDLVQYAHRVSKPRMMSVQDHKKQITSQFKEVFHLIGGIPRLALWADANPSAFYALYSKLIPASLKVEITDDLSNEALEHISTAELKRKALEGINEPHQTH